jgi:hypothetical protein
MSPRAASLAATGATMLEAAARHNAAERKAEFWFCEGAAAGTLAQRNILGGSAVRVFNLKLPAGKMAPVV